MFGSALTLASFIKLLYSMFWGERPLALARVREAPWLMRLPLLTLSLITILSGLFYRPVIDALIAPALPSGAAQTIGFWQPDLAAVLLVLSLLAGAVFYLLGRLGQAREVEVFVGGESINPAILRVPGTDFYGPLKEVSPLSKLYPLGESGVFDIYTYGMRGVRWASAIIYEYIDQALSDFYQEVIPASLALTGQILKLLNSRLVLTRLVLGLYVLAGAATLLVPVSDVIAYTRILACLGMIGWGLLAWVESDLIRLLIFSATSQLGLVLLALTLTPAIALSYILNGLLALGVLYLIIRSITAFQGTTRIEILNGLAGRIPGRFLLFLLAALWLSGLPPFGSFFSKYLLGVAAGEVSPFLTIIITATAILTLAYLLRPIRHFLRSAQQEAEYKPADEHKPVTTT
jgi:formate hydrogenlyase subunit 3/multisubunit Na+/H+ antiporter MnhD subunit